MAQNHIVTCHACGQMFDTFRGGYYNAGTAQYTCRKCGRGGNPVVRGIRIGMRQTVVGMVLKILFGALFLSISMSPAEGTEWDISYFLVCVVLGAALIAWGVIPWLKARREQSVPGMCPYPLRLSKLPACVRERKMHEMSVGWQPQSICSFTFQRFMKP